MTPEQLLYKIVEILSLLKIPYAVTGGFAVVVWGRPRFTADIDIVIEMMPTQIKRLSRHLLSIDKDVYVSEVAMQDALERKGEFNFIHPQTGLKVDFWVKGNTAYEKLEIKRAVPRKIDGKKVFFISPEDLILSKLLWYKECYSSKHLEDIQSVIDNSKLKLDFDYIEKWAKRHSTYKILKKLDNYK